MGGGDCVCYVLKCVTLHPTCVHPSVRGERKGDTEVGREGEKEVASKNREVGAGS